uniref:Uncharacterized protein n=1 Tax=Pipistrellus kuhlii TaxID=59472 RepID=A0A7J8A7F3_PIPKU|nr:hypothetical protein mPipKuh1_008813 [Pipistrellus kuhlii]
MKQQQMNKNAVCGINICMFKSNNLAPLYIFHLCQCSYECKKLRLWGTSDKCRVKSLIKRQEKAGEEGRGRREDSSGEQSLRSGFQSRGWGAGSALLLRVLRLVKPLGQQPLARSAPGLQATVKQHSLFPQE